MNLIKRIFRTLTRRRAPKNHGGRIMWCKKLGINPCYVCLGGTHYPHISNHVTIQYPYIKTHGGGAMGPTNHSNCYVELYRDEMMYRHDLQSTPPYEEYVPARAVWLATNNPDTSLYLRKAIEIDYPKLVAKLDKLLLLA